MGDARPAHGAEQQDRRRGGQPGLLRSRPIQRQPGRTGTGTVTKEGERKER